MSRALLLLLALPLGLAACDEVSALDDPRSEVCGDNLVTHDEECDDGFRNSDTWQCTRACRWARCGDGLVGPGESCDDGNAVAGDGCDACRSPFDPTIVLAVPGAQSLRVSDDDWVYVAGVLGAPAATEAMVLVDGLSGAVRGRAPWGALFSGAHAAGSRVVVAPHPGGGAVLAGSEQGSTGHPVPVAVWVDPEGAVVNHYRAPEQSFAQRVTAVAVGPNGQAALAGTLADNPLLVGVPDAASAWLRYYNSLGGARSSVAVAVDGAGDIAFLTDASGSSRPWTAFCAGDGTPLWTQSNGAGGSGDQGYDVRFDGDELVVARSWGSGLHLLLERRDLGGGVLSAIEVAAEPGTLAGARLVPGGLLSWGHDIQGSWLVLYDDSGAATWRANQITLSGGVVDADAAGHGWVYAVTDAGLLLGWRVD